jgi:hypothetical protein
MSREKKEEKKWKEETESEGYVAAICSSLRVVTDKDPPTRVEDVAFVGVRYVVTIGIFRRAFHLTLELRGLVPSLACRACVRGGAGDTVGVVAHVDRTRAVRIRLKIRRAAFGVLHLTTVQSKTSLARFASARGGIEIADCAVAVIRARLPLHGCQKRQRGEESARGNHFFRSF